MLICNVVLFKIVLSVALPIYNCDAFAIKLAPTDTAIVFTVEMPVLKLIGLTFADDVEFAIEIIVELAIVLIVVLPTNKRPSVNDAEWIELLISVIDEFEKLFTTVLPT